MTSPRSCSALNGATTLARAEGYSGLGGADWDGTRAAYVVRSCVPQRADVHLDDLRPGDPVTVGDDCRTTPRGRRLRATRSGRVLLSFSCPKGCGGNAELVRGAEDLISTSRIFSSGPGTAKVTAKLTRSARRLLARRGRLSAYVEGVARMLDKNGSRPFLRNVTLLAPRR